MGIKLNRLLAKKLNSDSVKGERIYKSLVDSVKDYAIFVLDIEGHIVTWNAGAENLKGYKASEIIGKHIRTFYTQEDIDRKHPENELKIATQAGKYEEEGCRVRKDGSQFWASILITKVTDSEGNHIGFSKITRDLSERREYEESLRASEEKLKASYAALETTVQQRTKELLEAKQAAENANIAKSTFLANMSHEIRTPLGAIMGFADLIGSPELSKEDMDMYLAVVKRNSQQLLRIIDDILDLSKVEAGRMDIERIEFSLPEVLSDMASMMGLRASENSIGFELIAATALPEFVISDPTRLRQIIINVVGNAIKFTRKGEVKVTASFKDNQLELTVKDTGRGISKDQIQKLFQPFTQADAATNRKYGGTGLGLALTKSLCQILGGDLVLKESTLEKGSTFVATIGMIPAPTSAFTTSMGAKFDSKTFIDSGQILSGMDILVIEDSVDNQNLMHILLSRAGAKVDVATDGIEGVGKAMSNPYDAVIMDIQMPRMDGLEAMRILRQKNYDRPVVALSAHAMTEQKNQAMAVGFADYLTKPIQRQSMIELLKKFKRDT